MDKKILLDKYEQDIEDHFEEFIPILNVANEMTKIKQAAKMHLNQ